MENHFYEILTATFSHELQTPLNSMINLVDSLSRYIKDKQGQQIL